MFRPLRAEELRRAARATGAHRKNVAVGTARSAVRFTVATRPTRLTPNRCTAVSGPPQKYAYCSPVAPMGSKDWISRWVRSVTSGGGPPGGACRSSSR